MNKNFPSLSTMSQAVKIYKALNPAAKNIDYMPHGYTMSDIFRYLPHEITYNNHRGDLCISTVDITYFSIGEGWKHVLVHHEPIPLDGDIYDAFINMIDWLKKNNLM